MQLGTNIHGSYRMDFNSIGDSLTDSKLTLKVVVCDLVTADRAADERLWIENASCSSANNF